MRTFLLSSVCVFMFVGCESDSDNSLTQVIVLDDAQAVPSDAHNLAADAGTSPLLDTGNTVNDDAGGFIDMFAQIDAEIEFDTGIPQDSGPLVNDATVTPEPLHPIEVAVTPADEHYLSLWIDREGDFAASLRWLPHFIYEQEYVSICIRLDMRAPRQFSAADIEEIRQLIEDGVHVWQRGLVGEPNWPDFPLVPVHLFGVAHTESVTLLDDLDVPIFVNDEAKCPDECSRFHHRDQDTPDYSDCPRQDLDHFDFTSWYSDFDFGAAGHGGDWGTRLAWNVFQDELRTGQRRVSYHEIGHVAGLPDMYTYPFRDNDHRRPRAIMATSDRMESFDYLLIRQLWRFAWDTFYADN